LFREGGMSPPHNPTSGEVLPFGKVIDKRELDAIRREPPDLVKFYAETLQLEPPTLRDDVADFIADVRSNPVLAGVCAVAGVMAGMLCTVGLAYVWAWFAYGAGL
jgi:hypothetical protein